MSDWKYADGSYTLRHKVRLFLGINGQMHNGMYTFSLPSCIPVKYHRFLYDLMFRLRIDQILDGAIRLIPIRRNKYGRPSNTA